MIEMNIAGKKNQTLKKEVQKQLVHNYIINKAGLWL